MRLLLSVATVLLLLLTLTVLSPPPATASDEPGVCQPRADRLARSVDRAESLRRDAVQSLRRVVTTAQTIDATFEPAVRLYTETLGLRQQALSLRQQALRLEMERLRDSLLVRAA